MQRLDRELSHLSRNLIWRGAALLCLGFAASVWTEQTLVSAMLAASVVAVLFGSYEIASAFAIRRASSAWQLPAAHGLSILLFGLLTAGAAALSVDLAVGVVAAWLLLNGGLAFSGATLLDSWPAARRALIVWGIFDVLLALLAVVFPATTVFALLYFGALYAAALGAGQVALGVGLRRLIRARDRQSLAGFDSMRSNTFSRET